MAANLKLNKVQTRRRTSHFTLGQPSELPEGMLPLEVDIFNKFRKMKEDEVNAEKKKLPRYCLRKL